MKTVTEEIPGYRYGAADASRSPISLQDLEQLKTSAGFTEEDERYLHLAGNVLADQTKQIVEHWRAEIIARDSESGATFSLTGGRSDSRLPGEEQPPL